MRDELPELTTWQQIRLIMATPGYNDGAAFLDESDMADIARLLDEYKVERDAERDALREQLKDRESDLAHEYKRANDAEAGRDALRDALRDGRCIEWLPFTEAAQDIGGSILVWREDAGTFVAFFHDEQECWFSERGEDLTGDLPAFYAKMPEGPNSK